MRIGCCIGVQDILPVKEGKNHGELLMEAGFDYIELPLSAVSYLTEKEFSVLRDNMGRIKCEVCNVFLPQAIKIVGEYVDPTTFTEYLEHSLKRAHELGVEVIVLGSAASRNVPEGFSRERAWEQIVAAFQIISEKAAAYGITIVVEPLNRKESNIINSVTEGFDMVKAVERENVMLLADYYHMAMDGEDIDNLMGYGEVLRHVHFAEPEGRVYPKEPKEEYDRFFAKLKEIGYDRRVSFECGGEDLVRDAVRALKIVSAIC